MNILKYGITITYITILCVIAGKDWKYQKIDNRFHLAITCLALCEMCLKMGLPWQQRITGAVAVAVPMWLLTVCLGGGFGGGDIKLMAVSGLMIGGNGVIQAAVTGIMLSGVYCAGMLAAGKMGRKDTFPLGPFLATGIIIQLIWHG